MIITFDTSCKLVSKEGPIRSSDGYTNVQLFATISFNVTLHSCFSGNFRLNSSQGIEFMSLRKKIPMYNVSFGWTTNQRFAPHNSFEIFIETWWYHSIINQILIFMFCHILYKTRDVLCNRTIRIYDNP